MTPHLSPLPQQDCHPEQSEGSALKRPTTGDRRPRKKQILRRCAPQNDIVKGHRGDGFKTKAAELPAPIFEGGHEVCRELTLARRQ